MPKTATDASTVYAELLGVKFNDMTFTVEPGTKYDRIVETRKNSGYPSVHAFVEKATGFVYKAAGYKVPAKGVRFTNVLDAVEKADKYGRYLYKKF